MQPTRTGILGGRFDPIHVGHLDAAKVARQRLTLETVLVVPSRTAPHRATPAQASNADRLAMVTLATDQHAYLEPCDVELTAEGPSYTAITLSRLHELGHPLSMRRRSSAIPRCTGPAFTAMQRSQMS